jgi:hypothetical protein
MQFASYIRSLGASIYVIKPLLAMSTITSPASTTATNPVEGLGFQSQHESMVTVTSKTSAKAATVLVSAAGRGGYLQNNAMVRVLACTPVHFLVPHQHLIFATDNDTLGMCVDMINQHAISSLPITCHGLCIGFIDLLDIARFIVSHAPDPSILKADQLAAFAKMLYFHTTAAAVLNLNHKDAFIAVGAHEPASFACSILVRGMKSAIDICLSLNQL